MKIFFKGGFTLEGPTVKEVLQEGKWSQNDDLRPEKAVRKW